MSQRNPMNDRYTGEAPAGKTRKSAAAAKPKAKAAATVVEHTPKKTKQQKKAERKAERKRQQEAQREIDRKYYTPDTKRYRNLRMLWWAFLLIGVACVAISFLLRDTLPEPVAMAVLFAAYFFVIGAFYIDFSKVRKERKDYQARMMALEAQEARKKKAEARAAASRQPRRKGQGGSAEGSKEDAASEQEAEQAQAPAKRRRGFFGNGFRLPKSEAATSKDAAKDDGAAQDAGSAKAAKPDAPEGDAA